jgi:DNA invertase Pin-like site-specific DNA recombinase
MEAGVDFVCCDMPSANRLTLHILAAVAEDEARRISERTKAALAAYRARGGKLGTVANLTREAGRRGAATNRAQARTRLSSLCWFSMLEFMPESVPPRRAFQVGMP